MLNYPTCLHCKAHTYINDMLCFVTRSNQYIMFENNSFISLRYTPYVVVLLSFEALLYVVYIGKICIYDCDNYNIKLMRTTHFDEIINDAALLETGEVVLLCDDGKIRFLYSGFEINIGVRCHNITASSDRIFVLGESFHTFLYDGTRVTTTLPYHPCGIAATFVSNNLYLYNPTAVDKCLTL